MKSRKVRWTRHVSCMREKECIYSVLERKSEGRRPLESLGYRWEDNVAVDLKEIGWEDVDWI
jgi:hypothetical protein